MVKRCNNSESQHRKRSLSEDRKTFLVEKEEREESFDQARIRDYGPEYVTDHPGSIVYRPACTNGDPWKMTSRLGYDGVTSEPECIHANGNAGKMAGNPECINDNAGKKIGRQDWIIGSLELVSSSQEWTSGCKELVNSRQEWTSGCKELVNSSQEWTSGYKELVNSSQDSTNGSPAENESSPSRKIPTKIASYSPDSSSGNKEPENDGASEKEPHLRPKRKGTGSNTYVAAHLPKGAPCKVCGLLATGNHYDSITCEGCKGFFRRTVQNNKPETYSCSNGGECVVEGHKRSSCKRCRYDKCIKIGMNPEKVLDEYDRQKLNNQKADNRRKREEERRKAEQAFQSDAKTKNCSVARRRRCNPVRQTKKLPQGVRILSLAATPPTIRRCSPSDDSLQSLVNQITKQFKDMRLHETPIVDGDFCNYLRQLTELRECLQLPMKSSIVPYHCCFMGSGAFLRAQQSFLQSIRESNKLRYEFFMVLTCLEKSADEEELNYAGIWQWLWMRMLATYDPSEDAVVLDTGLMISRTQCHFFGCLVPETIFDLASRLHLVDPDLRVVMLAALSALATIDPDVQQPAHIQLMENNLLEGIRMHLDAFSSDPYSTFEMFVNVHNELHELCRTIRTVLSASDEGLFECYVRILIEQQHSNLDAALF